ncbi:verprolin-like [Vigna angularis]|uniref:verprolin-like n=1 Tax=Phaseolus angularis TaxID=3914 RepID=UPI0022B4FD7E|nr:verprolin-like [Vigna angularis]
MRNRTGEDSGLLHAETLLLLRLMRSFPRLCAPPPAAGISVMGGGPAKKTSDDQLSGPTAEDRPQKTDRGGYVETDQKLSGPIGGLLRMYSGRLSKHAGYSGRLSIHGKGVARPRKRQRQAPKYVLRVPARLPTTAASSTSYVGPPPTPTIQPPTPAVDHTPTSKIDPYSTPAVNHSTTPAADPLPPPVIISPTPPPVVITLTPLTDPTYIPSSSVIPPSETVTPSVDPDPSGDGEDAHYAGMLYVVGFARTQLSLTFPSKLPKAFALR